MTNKDKPMESLIDKGDLIGRIDINAAKHLIPTGYLAIDAGIVGAEGLPTGSLIELFGEEGCGKTTLAMQIAKRTQEYGGYVLLADTERWEERRMKQIGIELNPDQIARIGGEHLEKIFANIQSTVTYYKKKKFEAPLTIIFDSIALTPTKLELDAIYKGNPPPVAATAKILTPILKTLQIMLNETPILLIMINQYRMDLSNISMPSFMRGGTKKKTTGGAAFKYACHLRLKMSPRDTIEHNGVSVGYVSKIVAEKNKINPPGVVREYVQYYNGGIGNWHTVQVEGERLGLIEQNGSWYSFTGTDGKEVKYQGRHGILTVSDEDYLYMKEEVKKGMLDQIKMINEMESK